MREKITHPLQPVWYAESRVFCTGKSAFNLWKKFCAERYETQFRVRAECLPSTSPANARFSPKMLVAEYSRILEWLK